MDVVIVLGIALVVCIGIIICIFPRAQVGDKFMANWN